MGWKVPFANSSEFWILGYKGSKENTNKIKLDNKNNKKNKNGLCSINTSSQM
jgi:hypothetical protein